MLQQKKRKKLCAPSLTNNWLLFPIRKSAELSCSNKDIIKLQIVRFLRRDKILIDSKLNEKQKLIKTLPLAVEMRVKLIIKASPRFEIFLSLLACFDSIRGRLLLYFMLARDKKANKSASEWETAQEHETESEIRWGSRVSCQELSSRDAEVCLMVNDVGSNELLHYGIRLNEQNKEMYFTQNLNSIRIPFLTQSTSKKLLRK